ncbi:restriction endonuclease subunit S [Aeromonas hydrophila]|uniref:restriction endonuclease subunit S n=1 Tax=Aeromonas hydrophila TaxID=644 RepID=UPI00366C9222
MAKQMVQGKASEMAATQTIPTGYKQTEVGIIPEDWAVCELQDAVEFLDGQRRPIKSGDRAKIAGIYPYYGASGIVDYVNDYIFDEELILLGEDGENILSRNVPLAFKTSGKIWVNNHAHVLRPQKSFHISFLTDFLENLDYSLLNSGTAQPKLNKQTCQKIKIIKPRHEEQTAIAKVLSDTNALIASLGHLVTKKQAIKTATMQQLLTGRTRLSQFALRPDGTSKGYKFSEQGQIPEDWEVCELQDAVIFLDGQRRPIKSGERAKMAGGYPYYGASGIVGYVNDYIFDEDLILLGEDGENILSRSVPLAFQVSGKIWVNNHAHVLRPQNDFHIYFLTEYLESLDYSLFNSGTAQPKLNKKTCQRIKVIKPKYEEQTAIATILSDMDSELTALAQKLAKARDVKQGMMQQLLTGRIRLPLEVVA